MTESLSERLASAKSALEAGKFEHADRLLIECESDQQTLRTLVEIKKQAAIRALRATTALLKGLPNEAFNHFVEASAMFDNFDQIEGAALRYEFLEEMHWHGRYFGQGALVLSIQLADKNLKVLSSDIHPNERARTLVSKGLSLNFAGMREHAPTCIETIRTATACLSEALALTDAKSMREIWIKAKTDLAISHRFLGTRLGKGGGFAQFEKAISSYEDLLEMHIADGDKESEARVRANMCTALVELGLLDGSKEEKMARFSKALDIALPALQVYTVDKSRKNFVILSNNIGTVFTQTGLIHENEPAALYINKGLRAFREAKRVNSTLKNPFATAMLLENIGEAHEGMSVKRHNREQKYLRAALRAYDKALDMYENLQGPYFTEKCRISLNRVRASLCIQ